MDRRSSSGYVDGKERSCLTYVELVARLFDLDPLAFQKELWSRLRDDLKGLTWRNLQHQALALRFRHRSLEVSHPSCFVGLV